MFYANLTIIDVAKKTSTLYYLRRGSNNRPLKDWTHSRHEACLFRTIPEAVGHLSNDFIRKDEFGKKIIFKYKYDVKNANDKP